MPHQFACPNRLYILSNLHLYTRLLSVVHTSSRAWYLSNQQHIGFVAARNNMWGPWRIKCTVFAWLITIVSIAQLINVVPVRLELTTFRVKAGRANHCATRLCDPFAIDTQSPSKMMESDLHQPTIRIHKCQFKVWLGGLEPPISGATIRGFAN